VTTALTYLNGQFVPDDQATIALTDRAHHFSDAVYEAIAFFNRNMVDATPHLERLAYSCGELAITNPHSQAEWLTILQQLLAKNPQAKHGGIYLQLSRGSQPRNHVYQNDLTPNVSISLFGQKTPSKALTDEGASVITHPDLRWKRCDIKTTSLLGNVMAKQAAHEAGAKEAVMVKENGEVSEASISNFFIVKDSVLHTHPATHEVLNGIVRQNTLRDAKKLGIRVQEAPFTTAQMFAADEAFLPRTTTNLLPVTRTDGTVIGTGKPGPVSLQLLDALIQHIHTQTGYALWS